MIWWNDIISREWRNCKCAACNIFEGSRRSWSIFTISLIIINGFIILLRNYNIFGIVFSFLSLECTQYIEVEMWVETEAPLIWLQLLKMSNQNDARSWRVHGESESTFKHEIYSFDWLAAIRKKWRLCTTLPLILFSAWLITSLLNWVAEIGTGEWLCLPHPWF